MSSDASILVVSCDRYADLWRPFFNLMWRYWPDAPFKIYLGANFLVYNDSRVETLTIGEDPGWSTGLKRMLEQIESPAIVLMLEDFFLRRPVDTEAVVSCLRAFDHLGAHMVRLVPRPGPDRRAPGFPFLGAIRPSSPYRVSTQGTLWQKTALLSLVREGENIWDFELNGTVRSQVSETGYYCVRKDVLTYGHHVIERGKWLRREARRFGGMDIGCDFSRRPVMSFREDLRWRMSRLLAYPKGLIPWSSRQKIIQVIRGGRQRADVH